MKTSSVIFDNSKIIYDNSKAFIFLFQTFAKNATVDDYEILLASIWSCDLIYIVKTNTITLQLL